MEGVNVRVDMRERVGIRKNLNVPLDSAVVRARRLTRSEHDKRPVPLVELKRVMG